MPFEKFLIHNSIITQAQKDVEVQKLKPPAIQSLMFMLYIIIISSSTLGKKLIQ